MRSNRYHSGCAYPSGAARLIVALAVFVAGCSGNRRASPVDPDRARDTLRLALEGWKNGDPPSVLHDGSPSITVQDTDWLAGMKLVDYQVTGDGKAVESNLYVPVKLTLRPKRGKDVKKAVSYIVGTSPILTVFRDFR